MAGKWFCTDEVAGVGGAGGDGEAGGGKGEDRHTEAEALDFAAVHGEEGGWCAEEGDYVGPWGMLGLRVSGKGGRREDTAGDGGEVDVSKGFVDVFKCRGS